LSFIDREGHRKSMCCRIVFGPRIHHAGIRIAMAAVVRPQQFAVLGDAVRIIDVITEGKKTTVQRINFVVQHVFARRNSAPVIRIDNQCAELPARWRRL